VSVKAQSTAHLMGAPCSRQLTWAEKDGRSPSIASHPRVKAFEEFHIRPKLAGANMGHPSGARLIELSRTH
jgi:hypothetical protein